MACAFLPFTHSLYLPSSTKLVFMSEYKVANGIVNLRTESEFLHLF
jgi:hypothetical protein